MRGENFAVGVREEGKDMDAMPAYGGLGGVIGVVDAGKENREAIRRKSLGNGLELGGADGESVAVGELVQAGDDSGPDVLRLTRRGLDLLRRHCVGSEALAAEKYG